ncbi:NAD(P)-binding protein [Lepidopterella palustris CBS 459.81]|uniref:NAD(P)-binding protein n=1 Tax=Lepidopterella palustris CBS 459.81 TaxID=1314670 RepID=A0A8E2JAQ5_9PEZI|nr:NAD(P)-binding protein [Lepidopterella palustris CBS 459.81]
MASLEKSVILITGANSGVGYDTSYALASASPNNHIIMACRNPTKGQKAISEISARKPAGTLSLLELDVSNDDSIATAAKTIESEFGRLDVLVNNAGIVSRASDPRTELRETFETNTFGPYILTEALVPLLKKSKDPRIINVTSGLGSITLRTDPNSYSEAKFTVYRMTKAALNMLAVCQHAEFSPWGCKVWTYCPGYVVTNLTGEDDRENRKQRGAESSETSAKGILEIVEGRRDGEVGGFIARNGKSYPW